MSNVEALGTAAKQRTNFLRLLFGDHEGYIRVAKRTPSAKPGESGTFEERFFRYPEDLNKLLQAVALWETSSDVYFAPMLFERRLAKKEGVAYTPCVWADLDDCPPDLLKVEPTFVLQTSPDRYQALWLLSEEVSPGEAELLSKRVAYAHADDGADKSGWDLTQLLRFPWTHNFKYGNVSQVLLAEANNCTAAPVDFETAYPDVSGLADWRLEFPQELDGVTGEEVMARYKDQLATTAWILWGRVPEGTWSESLFKLMMCCFEAEMSPEETFLVARSSACNKFARDGRGDKPLWDDVCRAYAQHQENQSFVPKARALRLPDLLTDQERADAANQVSFVEEYIEWAKGLGDAAPQYHEAGAFVALSSVIAGPVRLPTSFGDIKPNLWFMILADTTLTRKTTAMDIAMDLVADVVPDAILATDGSIEGLFSSLSGRPGRPSIFLRDEFSGLIKQFTTKDYYAGMAETLTKLYDGKFQKRILRRETIEVKDPVLIMFAGGIREALLSLLTHEHVASGFLPRFIFITADSDVTRLRPLGPPSEQTLGRRDYLRTRLAAMHAHYTAEKAFKLGETVITNTSPEWKASLTPEAWARYNRYETIMLQSGLDSPYRDIFTPCFDRLSKSGLKVATLLAATRLGNRVVVEEQDIIKAFYYVERWREHTVAILSGIGRSQQESMIMRVMAYVQARPIGVYRSEVMNALKLTAKEADMIFTTLQQRGLVTRKKQGRGEMLIPIMEGTV